MLVVGEWLITFYRFQAFVTSALLVSKKGLSLDSDFLSNQHFVLLFKISSIQWILNILGLYLYLSRLKYLFLQGLLFN